MRTLGEMKTRAWRVIGDDPANPQEILADDMRDILNEGYLYLGEALNYHKTATITLSGGSGTLPADFIKPERLEKADGTEIKQISTINDKVEGQTCYYIPDNNTLTVFSSSDVGQLKLYYLANPPEMVNDSDEPALLPIRFRTIIPELFVKAQYALRNNKMNTAAGLMNMYDQYKEQIDTYTKTTRNAGAPRRVKAGLWR